MDPSPEFSVICVCRNEGSFLSECVGSVLNQTEGSFEFILIDDHSTDDTWSLMQAAAAADARVTAFRNPTRGKVAGFNHAVDRARGRWIHLLGGDDLLVPSCLEECRRVIDAAGSRLSGIYHDYTILSKENGDLVGAASYGPWLAEAAVEQAWAKKCVIGGGFFVIRADHARSILWPQPVHWNNEDQVIAAVLKGLGEVRYLARPLYVYRMPDRHYSSVPTLATHQRGVMQYSEGLQLFQERSPVWGQLPAAARTEAERHFRHARLLGTPGWSLADAWRSRLGWRQLAMVLVLRYAPRLFPFLVAVYRWIWNLGVGIRSPARR